MSNSEACEPVSQYKVGEWCAGVCTIHWWLVPVPATAVSCVQCHLTEREANWITGNQAKVRKDFSITEKAPAQRS